jgi:hypothetical protein
MRRVLLGEVKRILHAFAPGFRHVDADEKRLDAHDLYPAA